MFRLDENARQKFYKSFGKTEQSVNEDIKHVRKWMETQQHLPEVMEDAKIRNFLQLNKFDLERTKEKIDSYYTIRAKMPDLFQKGNPNLPNIQAVLDNTYCSTHPTPCNGTHRVIFLKHKEPNVFTPVDLAKLALAIFEIRLFEDCMINDIIVFDLSNLTVTDMLKVSPKFIMNAFSVYKKVFSLRLKTLYFVNSPFYVSAWMTLLKFLLKPKLLDRVQVRKDTEVVKELFNNEEVPKDYGGDGPTLEDLNGMIKEKLLQYQQRFDKMDTLKVDETLRPKKR